MAWVAILSLSTGQFFPPVLIKFNACCIRRGAAVVAGTPLNLVF